jgi:hypothetical protein
MWDMFGTSSGLFDIFRPDQIHNTQYVYFVGALNAYNLILHTLKNHDPATVASVTQAMRENFDDYFTNFEGLKDAPKPS